jgi:intracellular sulfur oxidation DsrE/DsrF family protein
MLLGGRVSAAEKPLSADLVGPGPIAPQETGELRSLIEQLGKAPRRRDFKTNTLIDAKDASTDIAAYEDPNSVFGAAGNTIPALQQSGVVFMACHNAIWEHTAKLLQKGINPDRRSHEAIAAELTNHLIEGLVLTPGMVGAILELQQAGFHYAK